MRLNTLKPAPGAKRPRLRVGRGASAGQGKTCGRGTKGQRARKGGYHKVGFEGGQMPIQRRMPKVGFRSAMKRTRAEVRLDELAKVDGAVVDIAASARGLGLRRIHQSELVKDTRENRGMINAAVHLLRVEEKGA